MEHIVQFGINLDDSAIEKLVVEEAAEQLRGELMENITRNMPRRWYASKEVDWQQAAAEMLQGWFEENKADLMEMAAEKLASKAVRTKAWRERMGIMMGGDE